MTKKDAKSMIINGVELKLPKSFSSILPVSSNFPYFDYEDIPFIGLKLVICSGDTVFDIGSSYGIISCLISKLTGPTGRVFSFEANPYVIEMGMALAEANRFSKKNNATNISFINKFVSERSGITTDFFIVPGIWDSLCSTKNPNIIDRFPDAVSTNVPTITIDDFIIETGIIPNVCKIDVEGAEYLAVKGMQQLLLSNQHKVDLVIETHGDEMMLAIPEGGDMDQLLSYLLGIGYGFFDLTTLAVITKQQYEDKYAHEVGHVLVSRKLANPEFVKQLLNKIKSYEKEITLFRERKELADRLKTIQQEYIDKNSDYQAAELRLKELVDKFPNHPLTNYLYALSLHMQKVDLQKAMDHYNTALQNGFDEFWVKYNRASVLAQIGKKEQALADIKDALRLKPDDAGSLTILKWINSISL